MPPDIRNPTAAPALSPGNRPGTTNYLVMVIGDTGIDAFVSSGILKANPNICVVLASTERATIEGLDQPGGFRSRFPERVFTAYMKPAPADFAQAREALIPWLTPRPPSQRLRGGPEGALDRPDAATRLLLSEDFRSALNAALIWAHARPISGNHLAVGVVGVAVAGRMTGSGALVPAVDILEDLLANFKGADEVWIDLLIGTASIHQHADREFDDARVGSTALIAELGAAVADPAAGGGTLKDVPEANASLQLALSAIVSGASQRQREALRPGANRTMRRPDAVFAGIGVLEVVFDPALASSWVARRLLATMPQPIEPAPAEPPGTYTQRENFR
jgi:hypothetical protein